MGSLVARYVLPLLAAVGLDSASVETCIRAMFAGALMVAVVAGIACAAHVKWWRA